MLYDDSRQLIDVVEVKVGHDLQGLKKSLYETFPREEIEVRALADGIYLSGDVSTEAVFQQAEKMAQAFAPQNVTNGLSVKDSHQVMLEVRFVEASRSAGVTTNNPVLSGILSGGLGGAALDLRIEALEDKGIIRTLAEPNLVAMSGETASFLAGGEIPIPVPTSDCIGR